ncbi:effector protein A, substrate of the Dot/Icm secretion system [Legionella moravica]|uniref:Effector protein A, substrate of the Dot/Icm secretion system n=1 Tax=Legionella moravica TaxID=39962 RepID=A0A378JZ46_9GAMM|nr:hypothetical protein [Legionella moravica]KTD34758.1 effector protein A, substrate of the Dot/Icm secretion system [Legionella moravica]STX63985.1 effector protein A, substrate of the Dot/Icm secretion system [Legionella moravica]
MNEIILQLLNEISALKHPIDPLILKNLFDKTLFLTEEPSAEYIEHFNVLKRLHELAVEYNKYNNQLADLEHTIQTHAELCQQIELTQSQITDLQERIHQLKSTLLPIYKDIEIKANEFTLASDPLAVIKTKTSFVEKKTKVAEFSSKLVNIRTEIDNRIGKAKLVINKSKFDTLAAELNELDITCSHNQSAQHIQNIISKVSSETEFFSTMQKTALFLQKKFSERLSNENLPIRIRELEQEQEELTEHKHDIETQLANNSLDEDVKIQLIQEFTSSADRDALICSYRKKMDSFLTYLDPVAWTLWGINLVTLQDGNRKHDEEQRTISLSVKFLELLTKKSETENKQLNITKSIIALQAEKNKAQLVDPPQIHDTPTNSINTLERSELVSEALQLLYDLPPSSYTATMVLNENSPDMHFLETIILNIPAISYTLERKGTALTKLNELFLILNEINRLRADFNLISDHDILLPTIQDAKNEEKTFPALEEQKDEYTKLIGLCDSYLQDALTYDKLAQQLTQTVELQKQLKSHLKRPPKEGVLESISNHLTTLKDVISLKLNQLIELPAPATINLKAEESKETHWDSNRSDNSTISQEDPVYSDSPQPTISINVFSTTAQEQLEPKQKLSEESEPSTITLPEPSQSDTKSPELGLFPEESSDESLSCSSEDADSDWTSELDSPSNSDEAQEYTDSSSDYENNNSDLLDERFPAFSNLSPPQSPPNPVDYYLDAPSDEDHSGSVSSDKDSPDNETDLVEHVVSPRSQIIAPKPSFLVVNLAENSDQQSSRQDCQQSLDHHIALAAPLSPISENECSTASTPDNSSCSAEDLTSEDREDYSLQNHNLLNTIKWHHEILGYLNRLPNVLQKWYKELYLEIKFQLNNELNCYKAAHIVRDILFEVEHMNNTDVLNAYMRLCPQPSQGIEALLAIKPSLFITDEPYNESDIMMDCPKELKKHYDHYSRLKKEYPIEAELFLQAVRSVHMMQLYVKLPNRTITADQIPSLATDPRYDPLKRHRGFMKLWEFLEDLYRFILGKIQNQPVYEYSKKPCLFNTKSHRLIKEADEMMHDLLPLNTP